MLAKGVLYVCFIVWLAHICASEDFYKLLNISKDATTRELRRAFKKAALENHPDKNQDNPEAHDKFVLINRAYETLRDPDKRKRYDLFGEESGEERSQQQYHSWGYYHDNFGIYDDDPEIVTLDRAEFDQAVRQSDDMWFVNFYSPGCGHCHTLAPVWRRLARELENVVRIGAVNCGEEWRLCREEGVHAYPELVIYPEGWRYEGERSLPLLLRYLLRRLRSAPIDVDAANLEHLTRRSSALAVRPWLMFLCSAEDEGSCASEDTRLKLAAMMEGVLNVGQVDCTETPLCDTLGASAYPVYFEAGRVEAGLGRPVQHLDAQDIAAAVLELLPPPPTMSETEYESMRSELEFGTSTGRLPWLVQFVSDLSSSLEMIRLPSLLSMTSFSRLSCTDLPHICADLHVHKHPAFLLFKPGGGYEVYHGRVGGHDVAAFAREAAAAAGLRALTPADFPGVVTDGKPQLVDFYAPWCPPCMKLLPELRKASARQSGVPFGSVDCTAHPQLCSRYNIRSYPTVLLYNNSEPHQYRGSHTAGGLIEFVRDILHPAVLKLSSPSALQRARERSRGQIWLIDFYADWCGPCQQFAPEYRRAARLLEPLTEFVVAMVDCADQQAFCQEQGIRSYPTVRLYPADSEGLSRFSVFGGHREAEAVRSWALDHLPDQVSELTSATFLPRVLDGPGPWLVDFYAPWCGHCHAFAPIFKLVAKTLEGEVQCGKVDCERHRATCRDAGVSAYPTLKLYRGGGRLDMVGTDVRSQEPEAIEAFVRRQLRQWGETPEGMASASRRKDEL